MKYRTIITAVGKAKIAAAAMNGEPLTIGTAVATDTAFEPDAQMTALPSVVWRGPIAGMQIRDGQPNEILVKTVLGADVGGFTLRGIGLLDTDGELIAVGNMPDTDKETSIDGTAQALSIYIHLAVESPEYVTVRIDPAVDTVNGRDLAQAVEGVKGYTDAHVRRTDNPHKVTAAQVGAYTKAETDKVINERVGDGTVKAAEKLATPRQINGADFDGTKGIDTAYSYNFTLGEKNSVAAWSPFLKVPLTNNNETYSATALVCSLGDRQRAPLGVWLVDFAAKNGAFIPRVTLLSANAQGAPVFGYYTADGAAYVAVYTQHWAGVGAVTVIANKGCETARFDPLADQPEDWRTIEVRVLQDAAGTVASAGKLATPQQINGTPFDGTKNIRTAYSFNGVLQYPALDHITGQAWQEFATAPLSGGGGASDYNHASYIFTCVDANPKPVCVILAEFGCAEKKPYVRSTVLSPGARVPQFGWVVEDSTVHFYLHTLNNYRSEVFVTVLGKSLQSTATPTLSTQLAVSTEPAGIVYSTDTRILQDTAGSVATAKAFSTSKIPDGTDYNTLFAQGLYICNTSGSAKTMINCPTDLANSIQVVSTGAGIQQILRAFATSVPDSKVWYRNYYSYDKIWGEWQHLYTSLIPQPSVAKLTTARKIGSASFDGTADITLAQIGAAAASHGTHVTYSTTAPKAAGTAAVGTAANVARGDHVHPAQTSVSGNAGSATKLATARKIGSASFDGTADITLAQIGAAAASHGTHVTYSTTAPKAAGTAAVGTAANVARGDHVHPAQTSVSGNAGSATKLATARTIRTNLASTSAASFDGTANAAPGVTGVLPVANGGTGNTTGMANGLSDAALKAVILAAHPVGSYYWSSVSTSPATLFGGTWVQVKDQFVLAAGDTFKADATGGATTHTLTVEQMPKHNHLIDLYASLPEAAKPGEFATALTAGYAEWKGVSPKARYEAKSVGGGQSVNHMPPYVAAYCWRRTA